MLAIKQPAVILSVLIISIASAKVYDRCELARELRFVHDIPDHQIPTWVCIAKHESSYNSSAINQGSGDHGLFQISQIYWCSPPGNGFGCNAACDSFRDDNLADDVSCIRRIYNEHKRISGDGFNAWVVYPLYCKGDVSQYVEGCYDSTEGPPSTTYQPITSTEDEEGDGYEFPPLPSPPKKVQQAQRLDQNDEYEFPPLPSTTAKSHEKDFNLKEPKQSTPFRPVQLYLNLIKPIQQFNNERPVQSLTNIFSAFQSTTTLGPLQTFGAVVSSFGFRPFGRTESSTKFPFLQKSSFNQIESTTKSSLRSSTLFKSLPPFKFVKPGVASPSTTESSKSVKGFTYKPFTSSFDTYNKNVSPLKIANYEISRSQKGFRILNTRF